MLLPFDGGYAGLQPLPGGGANLCAAMHGAPGEAARDAGALLARVAAGSALGARLLSDMEPAWARPLAVGGVPYGFRHRDDDGDGDRHLLPRRRPGGGDPVLHRVGHRGGAAFGLGGGGGDRRRGGRAALPRRVAAPHRRADALGRRGGVDAARGPYLTAAGAAASPSLTLLAARRTRIE